MWDTSFPHLLKYPRCRNDYLAIVIERYLLQIVGMNYQDIPISAIFEQSQNYSKNQLRYLYDKNVDFSKSSIKYGIKRLYKKAESLNDELTMTPLKPFILQHI